MRATHLRTYASVAVRRDGWMSETAWEGEMVEELGSVHKHRPAKAIALLAGHLYAWHGDFAVKVYALGMR